MDTWSSSFDLGYRFSKMHLNFSFLRKEIIKFIYSEKATKFCEISTNYILALHITYYKYLVEISQNFVAFSEYMNFTKKSHCAIIYWAAAAVSGAEPEIYWMAYKYITGEPPKLYREEGSPNSQVEEEVRNNYSWLNTRTYGKNAERLTLIWISRYLAQHSLNYLFLCSMSI